MLLVRLLNGLTCMDMLYDVGEIGWKATCIDASKKQEVVLNLTM